MAYSVAPGALPEPNGAPSALSQGMVHGSDPKAREAAKVRAVDFRGKAVGIREGALSATSDEIRSMLLRVAQTYDRVADGIEAAASLSAAGERSETPGGLDD